MAKLKTVGIKDLKNNLSAYLREVRRGTRILVSDRNVVVAELREPMGDYLAEKLPDPVIQEWLDACVVTLPSRPGVKLVSSPVNSKEGSALKLLNDERSEGKR